MQLWTNNTVSQQSGQYLSWNTSRHKSIVLRKKKMKSKTSFLPQGEPCSSRCPDNTAFKQQRLPAWKPQLNVASVLCSFFLTGAFCIAVGVCLILSANSVREIQVGLQLVRVRVVSHWNRLLKEVLAALEVFKAWVDDALGNLVSKKVSLCMTGS